MTRIFFYTLSKEVIHINPPNSLVTSDVQKLKQKMNIKGPCLCLVMFFHSLSKSMACLVIRCTWDNICSQGSGVCFFAPFISRWGRKGNIYISFPSKPNAIPTPLYTSIPELGDGDPIFKNEFAIRYCLCCEDFCTKCVKFVKGHFSKRHHQDLLSYCEQKRLQLWIHKGPCVQECKEVMNGSRLEPIYANIKINILWNCKKDWHARRWGNQLIGLCMSNGLIVNNNTTR